MSVEINVTDQIVEIEVAAGASVQPTWGAITGTLSNQTDLQNALNAKFNNPTGTTLQYLRGDGSLATFPLTLPVLQQVRNQSGTTMNAGEVVYINGATGNLPTIARAIANADATSAQTLGMVQTAIANNGTGYVVVLGTIGNLDTSAYTEGQQLYLSGSVAGGVTTTKQLAPIHLVYVGIVTRSHPTLGTIEVKVQNGYELDEIHDVQIISPTNGQVLKYNSATQLWQNSSDTDTGITSLNALTALSQTFATGTSGTDFNISSATSTHTFNLPSASATNRGLLTSADWTTFNNKQNALTNPVTGTGTSGQVAYFTGATTQSGSNNLFWDAANNLLTITHPTGGLPLFIRNGRTSGTNEVFRAAENSASLQAYILQIGAGLVRHVATWLGGTGVNMSHIWATATSAGALNNNMALNSAGNLLLGNVATDSGQRLQVTGDGYFSGSVGIGTSSLTGFSLRVNKNITGAATSSGVRSDGIVQSDVSGQAIGYDSSLGTQAAAFTLPVLSHYRADQSTFGAGSVVTTQYGFQVRSNLIGATNNYGFFGDIASGTGRWNLYMNGTAANYLRGNTAINTTTIVDNGLTINQSVNGSNIVLSLRNDAGNADNEVSIKMVAGSATAGEQGTILTHLRQGTGGGAFIIKTNPTLAGAPVERMRLDASGNLGIGAAPSYKLDVQGTSGTVAIRAGSNTAGDILYYGTGAVTGSISFINSAINATGTVNASITNANSSTGSAVLDINVPTASTGDPYLSFTTSGATNWSLGIDNSDSDKLKLGPVSNPSNTSTALVAHTNGNIGLSTATDAGFKLDVNGTMRVSGDASIVTGGNAILNIDGLSTSTTGIIIKGSGTERGRISFSNSNNMRFFIGSGITQYLEIDATTRAATFSSSVIASGLISSATEFRLNNQAFSKVAILDTGGGFAGGYNFNLSGSTPQHSLTGTIAGYYFGSGGTINFYTGSSQAAGTNATTRLTIENTGAATFSSSVTAASYTINDAGNITIGTTTGTKIGTATSQKISFWNATPIVQPTTAVAAAAFVANTGTAVNDASTFDGYTMAQVVKALRNAGLLQ